MPIGARPYAIHWQDWVNMLLGLWLLVSPWLLNYADAPAAAWNAWIFGMVVAAVAASALIQYARWAEWVNVAVGVWLVAAPWVLAFVEPGGRAVINHVIVGVLVAALALWDALAHGRGQREIVWE